MGLGIGILRWKRVVGAEGSHYVLVLAIYSLAPSYLREWTRMGWRITPEDLRLIMHFTRNWFHYGTIGFIAGCTIAGAIRGVLT